MKEDNYIVIQGWMRTQLKLKGNELLVYAIIYGFSQEKENKFKGSLQYLADWCGATKQGILNNLKSLIEKGFIDKFEYEKNGVKFCEYGIKQSLTVLNKVEWGIKQSLTNNILNNKENKVFTSKDVNTSAKPSTSFKLSSKKSSKTNKLYSNCIGAIEDFVISNNCIEIRQLLIDHLNMMCEVNKLYGFQQYKGILKKLFEIGNYEKVIKNSIEHGYGTFYQVTDYKTKEKKFDEQTSNKEGYVERYDKQDARRDKEFQKKLGKEGKLNEF